MDFELLLILGEHRVQLKGLKACLLFGLLMPFSRWIDLELNYLEVVVNRGIK